MSKKFPTTNNVPTIHLSVVNLCNKCTMSYDCNLSKIREALESIDIYIITTKCPYVNIGFTFDDNSEEGDII